MYTEEDRSERLRIVIRGAVQGVGVRQFIHGRAMVLNLAGWALSSAEGLFIEVEGKKHSLYEFLLSIETEKPRRASIQSLEFSFLRPIGFTSFEIRECDSTTETTAIILPDIATCPECLQEIFDSTSRRYLYPFTNCRNCGPRYSITEMLPYEPPETSMKLSRMCEECKGEYENPEDRRFHARPIACPACGPHLELWNGVGKVLATHHDVPPLAVDAIRNGQIVAVKGLGGFQFWVDARNESAVARLRERKRKEEKPIALLFPSLKMVKSHCEVSELEERLLRSPESPIVLLRRREDWDSLHNLIAKSVAPFNPYLGVMLPYTPLHHILMKALDFPVVATSGNLTTEPTCIDEHEAIRRLSKIADCFLVHNRAILRHVDDSVVRIILGRESLIRRARGYAPLPIQIETSDPSTLVAVGANSKNTVAVKNGKNVFLSQHIGDLETMESFQVFKDAFKSMKNLWGTDSERIACDLHSGYLCTQFAHEQSKAVTAIQHHYAHVASCMAENHLSGNVLGVSWDSTGYGTDGTLWGGEFLLADETSFVRVATFRRFRLPGGETAAKQPRRIALGLLYELFGDRLFDTTIHPIINSFTADDLSSLRRMLAQGVNSPLTSSVGKLFEGVASLLGMRNQSGFEGQAATELEFAIDGITTDECYPLEITAAEVTGQQSLILVDWEMMIRAILDDLNEGIDRATISAKFHNFLSETIVEIARKVGEKNVVLSGGCFQNKYLLERTVSRFLREGFYPYWHQRVPPNDGGIALGQIFAALKLRQGGIGGQRKQTGPSAHDDRPRVDNIGDPWAGHTD